MIRADAKKALIGSIVLTRYNNKSYRVDELVSQLFLMFLLDKNVPNLKAYLFRRRAHCQNSCFSSFLSIHTFTQKIVITNNSRNYKSYFLKEFKPWFNLCCVLGFRPKTSRHLHFGRRYRNFIHRLLQREVQNHLEGPKPTHDRESSKSQNKPRKGDNKAYHPCSGSVPLDRPHRRK